MGLLGVQAGAVVGVLTLGAVRFVVQTAQLDIMLSAADYSLVLALAVLNHHVLPADHPHSPRRWLREALRISATGSVILGIYLTAPQAAVLTAMWFSLNKSATISTVSSNWSTLTNTTALDVRSAVTAMIVRPASDVATYTSWSTIVQEAVETLFQRVVEYNDFFLPEDDTPWLARIVFEVIYVVHWFTVGLLIYRL